LAPRLAKGPVPLFVFDPGRYEQLRRAGRADSNGRTGRNGGLRKCVPMNQHPASRSGGATRHLTPGQPAELDESLAAA
jgi:hypothetical protein